MALADLQTLVADLIRDDAGKILSAERDRAIARAVVQYSQDRPRQVVEDVTADGSNFLPLPDAWADGDSAIVSLEYPVGEWPVSLISSEWYGVVRGPTGDEIRLAGVIMDGETVRATLAVPHLLDADHDTLPDAHHEAVASYTAALLMDQLASLHSGDTDSTINADSVEHRSQAQEYASRSRNYRSRYAEILGIDPKRLRPAGAVADLDLRDSRDRARLTHHPRKSTWPG